MLWNTIPNDDRLRLWKSLRTEIQDKPLMIQLEEVSKFCSKMPFGARTLDYYTSEDWPTPWEILFHSLFCTSSISLLMAYTLILASPDTKVELYLVEDDEDTFMLPVIEDHFVLNYELGKISIISDIEPDIKIIKKYSQQEIKTIT